VWHFLSSSHNNITGTGTKPEYNVGFREAIESERVGDDYGTSIKFTMSHPGEGGLGLVWEHFN